MVQLTRIYTKGGDKGQTSLGDKSRVPKDCPRIEAIGAVDEANAAVGVAALHVTGDVRMSLSRIQNDLFDLGADLCRPGLGEKLQIQPSQVQRLENELDVVNAQLSPLTSFVLPGGSAASAHLHAARTTVRRAERRVISLHGSEEISPYVIQYLNRLSDFLFVLARAANDNGALDVLWKPGETQT